MAAVQERVEIVHASERQDVIDLPLPIAVPGHALAESERNEVAEFEMIAADEFRRAATPRQRHPRAPEHASVHPIRWIVDASPGLPLAGEEGIAAHTLAVAGETLGVVASAAGAAGLEAGKTARGGLRPAPRDGGDFRY